MPLLDLESPKWEEVMSVHKYITKVYRGIDPHSPPVSVFIALNSQIVIFKKLDGVAPLIADPPPLKLHQWAKSTPSVKWP